MYTDLVASGCFFLYKIYFFLGGGAEGGGVTVGVGCELGIFGKASTAKIHVPLINY